MSQSATSTPELDNTLNITGDVRINLKRQSDKLNIQGEKGEADEQISKKIRTITHDDSKNNISFSSQETEKYSQSWENNSSAEEDDHIILVTKSSDGINNITNSSINDMTRSHSPANPNNQVNVTDLKRIASVQNDAEQIGELLQVNDVGVLYEKLKRRREAPNRVEVVTNEVLEKGIDVLAREMEEERNAEEDVMIDAEKIAEILQSKNDKVVHIESICALLKENYAKANRKEIVLKLLRDREDISTGDQLFEDVDVILRRFPNADPNEIFETLELLGSKPNRVITVINKLSEAADNKVCASKPELVKQVSNSFRDNPLMADTLSISGMFPDVDRAEIYALLEAHYYDRNRVLLVTEELLEVQQSHSQETVQPRTISVGDNDSEADVSPTKIETTVGVEEDLAPIAQLEKNVETMRALFPDCDPMYLYETLSAHFNEKDFVHNLSSRMFENRNYPKLRDRQEKEKKQALKNKLQSLKLNIEEFLHLFPDPKTHFYDENRTIGENYKNHARIQLENTFPMLHGRYITEKMEDRRWLFTPTLHDLEKDAQIYLRNGPRTTKSHRFRKVVRNQKQDMPIEPDEFFYKELLFALNEDTINDYVSKKMEVKENRRELAKQRGELNECGCCFDDEVLAEDILTCPEGHFFCTDCIRRSTEELIGQAKIKFSCLTADCDTEFTTAILQNVLSPNMFSTLLKKIQEIEIEAAGITDLVSCPFCSFATIMPDPEDKVLHCLNPDCLKESCRLCQEPSHIPLRCDEVEKQGETDMRTYIESRMSEAMIRVCWKCKKRFYKMEGCNKMTCSCGASMCYVCREPIEGYDHFNGPNGCPTDTDVTKLHFNEMERGAMQAREKYLREHPDVGGAHLKHDPLKTIEKYTDHGGFRGEIYDDGDDDEDDDYAYSDDYDD